MKKNMIVLAALAATMLVTSCASKKDLENCQNQNKELTTNYQGYQGASGRLTGPRELS